MGSRIPLDSTSLAAALAGTRRQDTLACLPRVQDSSSRIPGISIAARREGLRSFELGSSPEVRQAGHQLARRAFSAGVSWKGSNIP